MQRSHFIERVSPPLVDTLKVCTVILLFILMSRSSSGLGHRPFTAATRVRLPYGTPFILTRHQRDFLARFFLHHIHSVKDFMCPQSPRDKIKLETKAERPLLPLVTTLIFLLLVGHVKAQESPCMFIDSTLSFVGTPQEQARCLLRPVKMYGRLAETLNKLPAPLDKIIGRRINISAATLKNYLRARHIQEADIGGALSDPLSQTSASNQATATSTRYFVIHDVSTPNYLNEDFPININDATWEWNDLQKKWIAMQVAHVFINRLGESVTAVDFKSSLPPKHYGTKFARDRLKEPNKALQLHVELVQPRRSDPHGPPKNDAIAPAPGFTVAQLDRLALVYLAASVRRGEWLIPAFHAAMDAGILDAHDDPQNFDLTLWADRLALLLKDLQHSHAK